jgi:Lipase (class 3)
MAATVQPVSQIDVLERDSLSQFPPHYPADETHPTSGRAEGATIRSRVWDLVTAGRRIFPNRVPDRARALSTMHAHGKHDLIKLEVISRREIDLIRWFQTIALLYNIIYLVVVTCLARYRWATDLGCTATRCERQDFRAIVWFNFISISVFMSAAFVYGCYFLYMYCACAKTRRPEVVWAIILLLPVVVISNTPAINLDRIHVLGNLGPTASSFLAVCRYGSVAYCTAAVLLYIILKFGALERVDDLDQPYSAYFYVWRVVPMILLYVAIFAAAASLRIEFSPQPLVSLIALARAKSERDTNVSSPVLAATITIGTAVVISIVVFLTRYVHLSRQITRQSYVDMRLKVINVFFMFRYMIVPILITMTTTAICAALFPRQLISVASEPPFLKEKVILDVPYFARSGIVLVYCVMTCIESFVTTPSSFRPTFLEGLLIERLGLRVTTAFNRRNESSRGQGEDIETLRRNTSCSAPSRNPFDLEEGGASVDAAAMIESVTGNVDGDAANSMTTSRQVVAKRFRRHGQNARTSEEVDSIPPIVWAATRDQSGSLLDANILTSSLRFDETVLAYNMSWLAYLSDDVVRAALADNAGARFSVHRIWREKTRDLVAMVLTSSDWLIVSFRGTVSLANVKLNLQILMSEQSPRDDPPWLDGKWRHPAWGCTHARIHTGFYDAYCSLRDEVLECVKDLVQEQPRRRILTCGHSLGGALATQCAFDCRLILGLPEDKVTLITFGSPKVGNRSFARRFAVTVPDSFRLVNHSDFITNQPRSPVQIYDHIPRGVLIDIHGNIIVDPMFADLKLFHGNAAYPHVLAAYKTSLQAFVDHAFEESSDAVQKDFIPDWWDFSKYDDRAKDNKTEETAGIALTEVTTRRDSTSGAGEDDGSTQSGSQQPGTLASVQDMGISVQISTKSSPDHPIATETVERDTDFVGSPSARMLLLGRNALTSLPNSTKVQLEKLNILDIRNSNFREFDGTPHALLGTAWSPEFSRYAESSAPRPSAERMATRESLSSLHSVRRSSRWPSGPKPGPRGETAPGAARPPRQGDPLRTAGTQRSSFASGALGSGRGPELPRPPEKE